MAIGASLAAGARRARRGAVRGLAALAVTSAVTNSPALVPRPGSFSVPSGHSASAFAFATAASRELPGLAPLLMPLAGGVAWSRVRTGVHHRADVLLGSAIGAGLAFAVTARLERRHWRRRTPVGTVADRLAGTEHVLGVLPLGTSDNFARSLGIPVDPRRAAALLTDGKVATVDLGRFVPSGQRPRHFVHAATVGLNVGFARIATRGDVRERLDRFAYLLAAAYAMRKRPAFCCELRYAGTAETMTLTQLSVINAPVFGGPLQLSVPASNPGRPAAGHARGRRHHTWPDVLVRNFPATGHPAAGTRHTGLARTRSACACRRAAGGDARWRDTRHLAR
jgi:PAP2 superfamily/Diacylglycerol kinase catalytic domain